jgi:hypothetical protein
MESQEKLKDINSVGSSAKTILHDPVLETARSITESSERDDNRDFLAHNETLSNEPRWVRIRKAFRKPFAEFFGVFTMIIFGDGVVAQVVLSSGQKGDYQSINWG